MKAEGPRSLKEGLRGFDKRQTPLPKRLLRACEDIGDVRIMVVQSKDPSEAPGALGGTPGA